MNVPSLLEFKLVSLHIDCIGPFQDTVTTVDFTDTERQPCSIFLLMSRNGRGKTTVLEIIAYLMDTLAREAPLGLPQILQDHPKGRAQLDVWVKLKMSTGAEHRAILSLMMGIAESSSLMHWDDQKLAEIGADAWDRHAVSPAWKGRFSQQASEDDDGVVPLLGELLHVARLRPPAGFGIEQSNPETAPTVLYFPSTRDIAKLPETEQRSVSRPIDWNYRTVRRFDRDQIRWSTSLDNLLVWLKWLEDGRFESACNALNEFVFKGTSKQIIGTRKDPPEAIVRNEGQEHRLDQLSSGEKSLVLLFLLLFIHKTQNTVVLLDEVDLHLHPEWERRIVYQLKQVVSRSPGLTIIMSSHSHDVLERFDVHAPEPPLRKGGELLKDDARRYDVGE